MFNHGTSAISLHDIIPSEKCDYMPGLVGDFLYGDGYSKHFINLEMYDIIYENNAARSNKTMLEYYLSLLHKKHKKHMKHRKHKIHKKHKKHEKYREQTFMMCMTLVEYNGILLNKIKFKNDAICKAAVRQNCNALGYVPTELQSDEICMIAVTLNGMALRHVINQTKEICIAAVTQNGFALHLVTNQTEAICIAAVTNQTDAISIAAVTNQTDAICIAAVTQNSFALHQLVINQREAICIAAVTQNGLPLRVRN